MNINKRKQTLCNWLKLNSTEPYEHSIKLQKFLFLYETLSKIDDDDFDYSDLCGYRHGPVFSNVWKEYSHNRNDFEKEIAANYDISLIDEGRALKVKNIVATLSAYELSNFTHTLDIWKKEKDAIYSNNYNVPLKVENLSDADIEKVKMLASNMDNDLIRNGNILNYGDKYFILSNDDLERFNEIHESILISLANNEELANPIYVTINDEGVLEID